MRKPPATHLALVRLSDPRQGAGLAPDALLAGMVARGVHELAGAAFSDYAAASGLAAAVLAAHAHLKSRPDAAPGPILWVTEARAAREHGALSARGAQAMGLDPGRLLTVAAPRAIDALWCVEEALRSGAVAGVVAEIADPALPDFTQTRRLALAAEARGVPAILVLPHIREGATAATARWRVAAAPSAPDPHDPEAPGLPRWHLALERSRTAPGAVGRRHLMEFDDATLSLRLVDRLAARPAPPDAQQGELREAG